MAIRILIIGSNGQVGTALKEVSWPPSIQIMPRTHSQLDVSSAQSIQEYLSNSDPFDVIINAAVFMPVDACEKNPERALKTNGMALFDLGHACKAYNSLLIHFSTDYVFDGYKSFPYTESDLKNPLNAYGRSKYIGELILESIRCPYILIRSSWVFSTVGQNFLKKVWEWSGQDREIMLVDDQVGCPTYVGDLVEAVKTIIQTQVSTPQPEHYGTYHLSGLGATSWYDYAQFILEEIAAYQKVKVRLKPISSKAYQEKVSGVANRPLYAPLACEKIRQVYGLVQKDWRPSVKTVVKQLAQAF